MNATSLSRIVAQSCLAFLVAGSVFAGPISGPIDPTQPIDLPPTKPALPGLPVDNPILIESLLGFMIETPIIAFNNTGTLNYTAADGLLAVDADPLAILFNNAGPPTLVFPGAGGYDVLINILVAADGSLVGGVAGDDLIIRGAVDLTGDFIPDIDGVLLTGEVTEYMGTDNGVSTDRHSYRFNVTGGFLAGPFGSDIAVVLTSEQSDFTGDYTVDFSGEAKGDIGAVECTGTIGDFVWLDLDGNGIQDVGEDGIPNVQLVLRDAGGNVIDTALTDSNGFYQFDGLCAGTYTVSVTAASLPADVDVTLINAPGSNNTNDSNDPAGTTVTLPSNDSSDQDSDFGYVPVILGALGDYVWEDLNMDGIQDNNEPPIEGVMVNLYDCAGNFIATTTTNAVGFYQFDNLAAGCYQVEFIAPPGLVFTLQDQNGDALDSDPDPTTGLTGPINLGPGEINPDVDAGLFQPVTAELGDRFWEDLNGNGVQDNGEPGIGGVTVNLFDCAGNLLDSTVTEPNGMYLFSGLAGGCYVVGFEPPANCTLTLQDVGNNADDSDADPATGLTTQINLADGQSDLTWDSGCYYPAGLGDYVWNDLNQNGLQDDGPTGLPGLLVVLLDGTMTPTGMTTNTGPDGEYEFTDLAPGSYFVQFTNPAGFVFTLPNAGADDMDSDANGTGKSDKVILESGEFDPTIDAGVFVPDNPSISIEKSTNGEDADLPTGPFIPGGDPVLWEYVVTNTGNVPLINVVVTDDQGVAVDCGGQDTLAAAGQPGDSFTCTGDGNSVVDQYENLGTVDGASANGTPVTDDDPSHYFGADPSIDIEKATNGVDADLPTGPYITPGANVNWTYVVHNTGNVTLTDVMVTDDQNVTVTCPLTTLLPDQIMTCDADGIAVIGQYENLGSVVGTPPPGAGDPVDDEDPSHYFGAVPGIDIEKATNGFDADHPTGPFIATNDAVNWTYVVTNTGNVPLTNVIVTDDQGAAVDCAGQNTLAAAGEPGDSFTCTASGTATPGQYQNIGFVVGTPPPGVGPDVEDLDPSHYFGSNPAIDIEKLTNGEQADTPTGPIVPVGSTVTWTYIITNMGNVTLTDITLDDSVIGPVTCNEGPIPSLDPGDNFVCTLMGTALAGQYMNRGDTCGLDPMGTQVCDDDPSHYLGALPSIDIEKATNGFDADDPTGPLIEIGGTVDWTYVVHNDGNVPLINVTVTDDLIGAITCPQDTLAVDETMTCTATGSATAGQYANLGSVVGTSPLGTDVRDADPSHYFGVEPSIDIEKLTNGIDADDPNAGDAPQVLPGDPVVWTYIVTNTGNVPLSNVMVTDDRGVVVDCMGQDTLAAAGQPGDSFTCTASGFADDLMTAGGTVPGMCGTRANTPLYENDGSVVGTTPLGATVVDNDLSHYCNPEACALAVSKTCLIPMAPASNYVCDKPIDSLTMIYNGTQPVRIKAWKGPVGSTLLADRDNIQPNQEVTVMGFAGSPNNVYWEVFIAGTNTKLGDSVFHLSCSDDEMDGPEDCGMSQGNGKDNNSNLLDVWLLEGIVDAGGTLDCTAPATTGANECEFQSFPSSCETGDADFLTFLYTGGGCAASDNSQDDHSCSGSINGSLPATFTDDDGNSVTLNPGDTVTIPRNLAKDMTLSNAGGTETNVMHTSCSQPIVAGDVYGSLTLVQIDGMGVGTDVVYTYTITNTSDVDIVSLLANDNMLGPIPGAPSSLAAGDSVTLSASAFITETTTNVAIVDGDTADGQMCNGTAQATVTILPPPPCEVDGEGLLDLSSDRIKWELTNSGSFTSTIESVDISWPAENGALLEIKLEGTKIFDTDTAGTSASFGPGDWIDSLDKRQIQPGDTAVFEVKFDNDVSRTQDAYSITINFEEGCSVTYENTGLPFVCNTDITELTMKWDGTQTVDVRAYYGNVGSTLLHTQNSVSPGTNVTVSGYADSQNDVFWEILSGGNVIGQSKFHLSCSDNDMNGADDCGKRQGNGKGDDNGFVNDWLLEGMVDADGPFDCSNLP